jgi:mannosyltransferase
MSFVQRVWKRLPSAGKVHLPSVEKDKSKKPRLSSRFAFFQRPLRLKGNSKFSIPLGVVLLFPCIVVILILVLVIRHSKAGVGILIPAGSPPAIRYGIHLPSLDWYKQLIFTSLQENIRGA